MNKHLFITGPDGCGKSSLLREELGSAAEFAGGFVTLPALDEHGELLRCSLYPAAAMHSADNFEGEVFLDLTGTSPAHNNEAFRGAGSRMLNESACYPFTVIDEFGGFDLLVPQYRAALTEVLNSDRPVIGVFKDKKSAEQLKRLLGLSDRFTMITDNMRKVIADDRSTTVITMNGKFDFLARRTVRQWVKEFTR